MRGHETPDAEESKRRPAQQGHLATLSGAHGVEEVGVGFGEFVEQQFHGFGRPHRKLRGCGGKFPNIHQNTSARRFLRGLQ